MNVSTRRSNSRRGFTLAELLAVVALLAITAGVVAPATVGWLRAQKVQDSIDELRTNWTQARTKAMEEARPYRFQVLSDMTTYRLAPNEAQYWPEQTQGVNAPPSGGEEEPPGWVLEQALPEGVVFEPAGDVVNLAATPEATWLFLPDGRARLLDGDGNEHEEASIVITEAGHGRRRQIQLRALTAQSKLVIAPQ